MKIIKAVKLDKYNDKERYVLCDGYVYRHLANSGEGNTDSEYCLALYAELEDTEDSQYPLEDLLDQYRVNVTDVMEEKEEDGKRILLFEIEGQDRQSIENLAGLVGKRIFNYEEKGYIKLGIE